MPVERATTAYKHERLNCAQSVLRAFQEHRSIGEDEIAAAHRHGGGRAENGLCGALHAALRLTDTPATRVRLHEAFVEHAGAATCREIRQAARLPCVDCVRLAASLLTAHDAQTTDGKSVVLASTRAAHEGAKPCRGRDAPIHETTATRRAP